MEKKDKYLSEEDIIRLKAVGNFRSLTPLSPEELEKLSTVEEKYLEACRKIESDDVSTINMGLIELGCLNGYRDSSERIQEAAHKIQKLSQIPKKEAEKETEKAAKKTSKDNPYKTERKLNPEDFQEKAKKAETQTKKDSHSSGNTSGKKGMRNALIGAAALTAIGIGWSVWGSVGNKAENGDSGNPVVTEAPTEVQTSERTEVAKNNYAVGDVITFGRYERDGDESNGKEAIDWIVLEVDEDNNRVLVISEMGLDTKPYNEENTPVTWEECTLRKWLNEDHDGFYQTAFTDEEAEKIWLAEVSNEDNPEYGTEGGNTTQDKVFLLSYAEAEEYLKSDESRQCKATEYASNHGASMQSSNSFSFWWLRSPGFVSRYAACVTPYGSQDAHVTLDAYGSGVSDPFVAVRPALWLEI